VDDADIEIARIAAKEKENTDKKREINIPVQRVSAEIVLQGFSAVHKNNDTGEEVLAQVARLSPATRSTGSSSNGAAPTAHNSTTSTAVSSPRRRLMPGNILSETQAVLHRPVYKE